MKNIVLDGNRMTDIEQTHLYIKEKLDLPDYYGKNLDALWDILSVQSTYIQITLINRVSLANNIGDYADSLIKVFLDASETNKNIDFSIKETLKNIKVALLQLMPEDSLDGNLKKGIEFCKKSKEMGADIALFPEMWSVGYNMPDDDSAISKLAISSDDVFLKSFSNLAKELDMAIGITYLEKYKPLPRNTMTLFDRFGNEALTYAKLHTCDFSEECKLTPGDDFYVADLNTAKGNVKVGAMICYDREFPESARILMLKGAEIILVPNACPMEINRISQLRARAYENMVGIATANYPGDKQDCNGHSTAFDCIAYKLDEPESRDTLIIEADEKEGIFIADFPIYDIREYRAREVHGNAYRHPAKYKLLVSENIEYPFIREDYRK